MTFRSFLSDALRTVMPLTCVFCAARAEPSGICAGCLQDLPGRGSARCSACAIPTPGARVCGPCLRDPPAFSRTIAAADYSFPLDAAIVRFKYRPDLGLLAPLADLLVGAARGSMPRPDLVVPMPLSAAGLRARGFNQSAELGRLVARAIGVPLALQAATRIRDTVPQASLAFGERTRNVRGAFACDDAVAGQCVAVVDDVMTTGATVNELARTLRRSGAREVVVWVVARTPAIP